MRALPVILIVAGYGALIAKAGFVAGVVLIVAHLAVMGVATGPRRHKTK